MGRVEINYMDFKKMKVKLIFSFISLFSIFAFCLNISGIPFQATESITCEVGTIPVLDGKISTDEWTDANHITLLSTTGDEMVLKFKHDGLNLYLCIGTGGDYFTEVYLDVEYLGGYRPKTDDFLLHASSALFEQQGTGLKWGPSIYEIVGWDANTMAEGDGVIEYSISSEKMGLVIEDGVTLGIAFLAADVNGGNQIDYSWPASSDGDNPNSWGSITFIVEGNTPTNHPPEAVAEADKEEGFVPLTIAFTGTGTDTDGMVVSYYWDFNDGMTSSERNPTHIFNSPGTFNVKLIVTDDGGAQGTDSIEINAKAVPNEDDDSGIDDDNINQTDRSKSLPFIELPILIFLIFSITFMISKHRRKPL